MWLLNCFVFANAENTKCKSRIDGFSVFCSDYRFLSLYTPETCNFTLSVSSFRRGPLSDSDCLAGDLYKAKDVDVVPS
jgi:hypothetical protein